TCKREKFFCGKVIDAILEKHFPKKQDCNAPNLSQREIEIVELVAQGMTNNSIAKKLFLSIHTVSTHRKNILRKLQVKSASELVIYAIKTGLVEPPEKTGPLGQ
ncbi:MAG TPA: response regulator transcription factor, partial [Niastella sp.]|nr:response regulator transcription factor [Niastella sp.]